MSIQKTELFSALSGLDCAEPQNAVSVGPYFGGVGLD